mgnify:CR=1 FL=1
MSYRVTWQWVPEERELPWVMYHAAWLEYPELRHTSLSDFFERACMSVMGMRRLSVDIWYGRMLVGHLIAAVDDDLHIGPCLTVVWAYVLPQHRGKVPNLHRQLRSPSKAMQLSMSWSHRRGPNQYGIRYWRNHGQKG